MEEVKNLKEEYVKEEPIMMNVDELMATLQCSKAKAYKLIREWNAELEARGKLTIRGKINREYFKQKVSC